MINGKKLPHNGHTPGSRVRDHMLYHLKYLSNATIHVDPVNASGEVYHNVPDDEHIDFPGHLH